jgi:F-type H+-transporting ATPase subunit b
MSRLAARLTAAACLVLPAALALAADEHAGAAHLPTNTEALGDVKAGVYTAVTALVVFCIVFAVLATKVWPAISKALDERAGKIREEIEAAEMARQQAKDALEQYQQSLAQARAEAQKMIESTKAQQAALAAELRAKADAELNQMRDRAMRDIETAKRAAVSEIYSMGTSLAVAAAGKILRRNVNSDDTQRLVEESLQQLQTAGKN